MSRNGSQSRMTLSFKGPLERELFMAYAYRQAAKKRMSVSEWIIDKCFWGANLSGEPDIADVKRKLRSKKDAELAEAHVHELYEEAKQSFLRSRSAGV